MLQGGFELRDWESTRCKIEHGWEIPALGMKWNHQLDSLRVNMSWMNELRLQNITKRIMLSETHNVFDSIFVHRPSDPLPQVYDAKCLQNVHRMGYGNY
ncbi:hypothetical protein AVEN_152115-1 [Araneus ventricosus]|uniref:Uncharacterized protein n=1 Tax=Araneus ventricosus TaxID=182803 RepID=A0A4Y2NT19_ARAVE|nr:hypothetical protein AVEN_152115-1 [Araneus ventricosus]